MSVEQHPNYTAEQALARLKEGNERFVNGQARFPTVQKEVLTDLAKVARRWKPTRAGPWAAGVVQLFLAAA